MNGPGRAGAAVALLSAVVLTAGCSNARAESRAGALTGGDPRRGARVIADRGCGTCHVIPGIRGASGLAGPPLMWMASRLYIAGRVPNDADAMIRWVRTPEAIDPLTAMPNLGLSEQEARDVTAYLYTLR